MTFLSCVVCMMKRRPQAHMGLLLNAVITLSAIFAYTSVMYHPQLQIFKENMVIIESGSVFYILMFCSFFSIFYALATLYRGLQEQFGTFLLLGMRPRQLQMMLSLEAMIIGCCSVVFGVLLGTIWEWSLLRLIGSIVGNFEHFTYFTLGFHFSWKALGITVAFSLAIFLLAAVVMPFLVRNQRVVQLLRSERKMDDKPEPPIGFLRAIVSVLFLGSSVAFCFFLPIDMNLGFNEFINFFPYVLSIWAVFTFVGSYFFYRQGSVALAKYFRWNRDLSWRGIRLLWMGNMAHRLRDNSRFFCFFSVISLFIFTSASIAVGTVMDIKRVENLNAGKGKEAKIAPFLIHRLGKEGYVSPDALKSSRSIDFLLRSGLSRVDSKSLALLNEAGSLFSNFEENELLKEKKQEALRKNDRSLLEKYSQGIYMSITDYNEILKGYGKKQLSIDADTAVALCYTENCSGEGMALNPLPGLFGANKVERLNRMELWHPDPDQEGMIPQWVLGDRVYARASQYPGIQKLWDVNYVSPQGKVNFQMIKALIQAKSLIPGVGFHKPGEVVSNDIVYNEAEEHERQLGSVLIVISTLLIAFVFIVIAGNFLLLRIYTDVEGQRQQFFNLLRIGFSMHHIRKSITIQIALMFFLPLLLSVVLASGAIYYGVRFLVHYISLTNGVDVGIRVGPKILSLMTLATGQVIAVFLIAQVVMFFLARFLVLRTMKGRKI
ncbi:FtsX-like permease family protein [Pasteuria penetrans]|uniref:FtsX-like permease family protein n=1 Tax=Pasteuria penetrans TaxID=86005 RepID=UPI00165C874B|nr:ABC transporter permease [Pasteuria penetrans]